MDRNDVARRRKEYPQKCVRNKRETVPVRTVEVVRTVLNRYRYGWGVNAKNTLYHVLAKTHVIPQVLRVRAKVPGPPYLLHDAWQ